MNLIDRNKIMYTDISDGQVPDGVWISFRDRINKMPTVDAIPISIIKEELEYARKMYDNSTELTEPYWRGNVTALELLIIKWEKENEQNDN